MSQKAVENVLKRVSRLVGWWKETERIGGNSIHKVITIADADFKTLKEDVPVSRLNGVTENADGTLNYQEFVLARAEDKINRGNSDD